MNGTLTALDSPSMSWNSENAPAGDQAVRTGIRITPAQASRFWSVDEAGSEAVLEEFVMAGFARAGLDGSYVVNPGRLIGGDDFRI